MPAPNKWANSLWEIIYIFFFSFKEVVPLLQIKHDAFRPHACGLVHIARSGVIQSLNTSQGVWHQTINNHGNETNTLRYGIRTL